MAVSLGALTLSLRAQVSSENEIAHFRFDGNAEDEHPGNPPFQLRNTEFRDNALYLSGKYEINKEHDGYRAVCSTPKFNYDRFTVALRFKAEDFHEPATTIFVGGTSYRWFRLTRSPAGYLTVGLNQGVFNKEMKDARLTPGVWTVVTCGVDIPAHTVSVYINGRRAGAFNLPMGFKLVVADSPARESDKVWTFTDYSHGGTFHGLVDECVIYGEKLPDDVMARILKDRASGLGSLPPPVSSQPPPHPPVSGQPLHVTATAFDVSSLDSPFAVGGKLSGIYETVHNELAVDVSEGTIATLKFDSREVVGMKAFIAGPYGSGGGFRSIAKSEDFPIGKVINKGEPFVIKDVKLKIPLEATIGDSPETEWLGFEFAVRAPNGTVGYCYAHANTFIDGRPKK